MSLNVITLILFICAFFWWANRRTAKVRWQSTAADVEHALEVFLDLKGGPAHDDFDLFVGRPIADPELEAIRQECQAMCRDSDGCPESNPRNRERVAEILDQLQRRGASTS